MATKEIDPPARRFWFDDNVRGVLIVVVGSAAIVGLAFGAMVVLTSPDGWVTKAATSAINGEPTSLVSFDVGESQ